MVILIISVSEINIIRLDISEKYYILFIRNKYEIWGCGKVESKSKE